MSASTGKQVQSGWACRKLDYGHVDSNDDEKQGVQPLQWKHGLVNFRCFNDGSLYTANPIPYNRVQEVYNL